MEYRLNRLAVCIPCFSSIVHADGSELDDRHGARQDSVDGLGIAYNDGLLT
jgi:hypothetical protein